MGRGNFSKQQQFYLVSKICCHLRLDDKLDFKTSNLKYNPAGLPGHLHQRDAREPGGGEQGKLAKRLRSLFLLRPEQSRLDGHKNPK